MLKIQRASAGSGKTYALARTYILNLLAYKTEKGVWKLRNRRQIEDSISHILAITFTNKATNEMKSRIVESLSLLSQATNPDLDEQKIKEIPYLQDFHDTLGASYSQIGNAAKDGLKVILNNFTLFKISTIDSFFQEILRTFAYETNINENYQLEIDSKFINEAAIDAAFRQLDSDPGSMGNATFWIKNIMNTEAELSNQWNLFNKKQSDNSIYSKIRSALKQLESEDFKDIKDFLDAYYANPGNKKQLADFYKELKDRAYNERKSLLSSIKKYYDKVVNLLDQNDYKPDQFYKNFKSQLEEIKKLKLHSSVNFSFDNILKANSVFTATKRPKNDPLDVEALELYKLLNVFKNPAPDSYYSYWKIYGELLPYLALLIEVKAFLSDILENNNLIQLSDTSYILKKIIGDEDAPFIYERIGNRIDHYLIDEFQDTSRMQWDIIHPLLREGVAKNLESLIIGDPKQSIYRFRNADHTLITSEVPHVFPKHIAAGFSKEENTNWRSLTNIVRFNNYFFKALSSGVSRLASINMESSGEFEDLYSNVVQFPGNQSGKGYIEVKAFIPPVKGADSSDDFDEEESENNSWFQSKALQNIGPLISSLLNRGYRQKDIAVLVSKNDLGEKVIKALIDYNRNLSPEETLLDFISEESLLISSSNAVEILVGVLRILSHPVNKKESWKSTDNSNVETEDKSGSAEVKKEYVKWEDIKIAFKIFSNEQPDLPLQKRLMQFLSNPGITNSFTSIFNSLPTPSLSSIVELAVKTFVNEEIRKSEALFISAFQDLVTEFSNTHHNDPASFVEWWDTKGKNLAVASPDGTDAINIMTIHKSKGLEFKCVIIPFATDKFNPSSKKAEWRWVSPEKIGELEIPPILPVITSKNLKESKHKDIYYHYLHQTYTDKINMYYVAFTRARNELYIFTTQKKAKNPSDMSAFLNFILKGQLIPDKILDSESEYMMKLEEIKINEDETLFMAGIPLTSEEIRIENIKEEAKKEDKNEPTPHIMKDYFINTRRPRLRFVATQESSMP